MRSLLQIAKTRSPIPCQFCQAQAVNVSELPHQSPLVQVAKLQMLWMQYHTVHLDHMCRCLGRRGPAAVLIGPWAQFELHCEMRYLLAMNHNWTFLEIFCATCSAAVVSRKEFHFEAGVLIVMAMQISCAPCSTAAVRHKEFRFDGGVVCVCR